jgi:hypothetical protein
LAVQQFVSRYCECDVDEETGNVKAIRLNSIIDRHLQLALTGPEMNPSMEDSQEAHVSFTAPCTSNDQQMHYTARRSMVRQRKGPGVDKQLLPCAAATGTPLHTTESRVGATVIDVDVVVCQIVRIVDFTPTTASQNSGVDGIDLPGACLQSFTDYVVFNQDQDMAVAQVLEEHRGTLRPIFPDDVLFHNCRRSQALHGEESTATAAMHFQLGAALSKDGHHEAAIAHHSKALGIWQTELGNHKHTANGHRGLADAFHNAGEHDMWTHHVSKVDQVNQAITTEERKAAVVKGIAELSKRQQTCCGINDLELIAVAHDRLAEAWAATDDTINADENWKLATEIRAARDKKAADKRTRDRETRDKAATALASKRQVEREAKAAAHLKSCQRCLHSKETACRPVLSEIAAAHTALSNALRDTGDAAGADEQDQKAAAVQLKI